MSDFLDGFLFHWSQFLSAEPIRGSLVTLLVVSSLVAVGIAIEAGPRATSNRQRLLALVPAALLTLGSLVALCWLIADARAHDLSLVIANEWRGRHLRPEQEWLTLLGPVLVVAIPTFVLAVARTFGSWALSRCALLALLAGLVAPGTELVFLINKSFHDWYVADPIREHLWMLSSAFDVAIAVIVVVGLISGRVAAKRFRSPRPVSLVPLFVFVGGTLCFTHTRGHAKDRHHLVSLVSDQRTIDSEPIKSFPIAPKWLNECREVPSVPVVSFGRSGVRLDGVHVDQNGMRLRLELSKRNWSILHPAEPFPGQVILSVERARALTEFQPWLDTLSLAGYRNVLVTFEELRQVHTETLGTVVTREYCAVPFFLSPCSELRTGTIEALILEGAKRSGVGLWVKEPRPSHRFWCCG